MRFRNFSIIPSTLQISSPLRETSITNIKTWQYLSILTFGFYGFTDTLDKSKQEIAKSLEERDDIVVSVQLIGEVCNILLRKLHQSEKRVQQVIQAFISRYNPLLLEPKHLLKASELRVKYRFSHWDSLLIVAAFELGASVFYSEDLHDGLAIEGTLTIRNPFR